ncbi:MAG: nickel pincer cofactor biosynthesis protein LarB [Leptospiraceae bacterium]|nr:nickel pincer cofactor biosynthesis protein LarB [Leptospiraceae bacterium]MCP5485919.1 nickel pincer cofactor biosynthesis protein LarB [Spirochaetales bacterium]
MEREQLKRLLEGIARGEQSVADGLEVLSRLPYADIGFARPDVHRALRRGQPESVLCAGKTPAQVFEIVRTIRAAGQSVIGTRATPEHCAGLKDHHEDFVFYEEGALFTVGAAQKPLHESPILVLSAGTSDRPVLREAAVVAEFFGNHVETLEDVGVAGLHRLLSRVEDLRRARVLIVVAGMDGALPAVVGGLVAAPVIAVPTSRGYGASFGGVAALLSMLNSCSSGVTVVNIDNGFGAACAASMINRLPAVEPR